MAEGMEIKIGTDEEKGLIIVEFPEPLKWFALGLDEALRFSELITDKVSALNQLEIQKAHGNTQARTS